TKGQKGALQHREIGLTGLLSAHNGSEFKRKSQWPLLAFGLFIALSARAENQAIAQLFQRAGVDGTIVIESL
ncbi:hypothetical protein, partial [Aeromonas caviae]|uniref:hypothetical protein n=1 Tax=Aeromonas caviae TaxID=648 RepID=UPI001CC4A3AD